MENINYAAIIFDVVDSQTMTKDRHGLQKVLKESIDTLNLIFAQQLKYQMIFGAGDEFQGLFYNAEQAFLYARLLQMIIYPIKVRCGIGVGTILYNEANWTSTEIDGEAYRNARVALDSIPGKGSSVIFINSKRSMDKFINRMFLTNSQIKNKQLYSFKMAEFVADMLSPLNKQINYDNEYDRFLEKLLEIASNFITKNKLDKSDKKNNCELSKIDYSKLNYYINKQILKPLNPENELIDNNNGWVFGMSTAIAEILSIKRQTIDYYKGLGGIENSRNIDIAIKEFLKEYYK